MTDVFTNISNFAIANGPRISIGQYCCEQKIKEHKEVWFLLCSNVAVSLSVVVIDLDSLRISNYCFFLNYSQGFQVVHCPNYQTTTPKC